MLIALKSVLHTLLLPPGGPLLVGIAGACLLGLCSGGLARRAGWTLLITSLASLWLLSTPAVADRLARAAQRYPGLDLTRPGAAQANIIPRGGTARPGG